MNNRIFLDTNIILDFLDNNRKNNSVAIKTIKNNCDLEDTFVMCLC